ncbi:MAG TPA: hypothetical protein VK718_09590 [Ferruginibacter sp.]|nr:hypothetical protein [Ferruginibacter sp.]
MTSSDSTPIPTQQYRLDSTWVGGGYGWTHHTYHWKSAHWEVKRVKVVATTTTGISIDSTNTTQATAPIKSDSTATVVAPKPSRVWVKGKKVWVSHSYQWIPGHWEAGPPVK